MPRCLAVVTASHRRRPHRHVEYRAFLLETTGALLVVIQKKWMKSVRNFSNLLAEAGVTAAFHALYLETGEGGMSG